MAQHVSFFFFFFFGVVAVVFNGRLYRISLLVFFFPFLLRSFVEFQICRSTAHQFSHKCFNSLVAISSFNYT